MLLLAVDTSGKLGSIALAQCEPDGACNVMEVAPLVGGTFSAQLVPQIAALLEKHGLNKRDIGAFAVATGPGSFTGLRVGLAAIKALAEVLKKPIATVSVLEAIAVASGSPGKLAAVLDAGRNEVFVGEYEVASSGSRLIREQLLNRDEFLGSANAEVIITPDNNVAEAARSKGLQVREIERPRSDAIANLGWKKIQAGETFSPEALDANYLRRSDAEIFSQSKF
jgi:tRNA threonylcarbamoyladenosine biosynthesis protein TsaB